MIQSAIAGAERVFEVMDEVPEIVDAPGAAELSEVKGEVVFEDVHFLLQERPPRAQGREPCGLDRARP